MTGFNPIGAEAWADYLDGAEESVAVPPLPSGFYARMQKVAARLIAKYATGQVILEQDVRLETENPLDPYSITTSVKTRNAYVGGYSSEKIGASGGLILAGDRRVVVDATGISNFIKAIDRLKIDGVYHSIVSSKPVPAAGTVSVYICQCRSAN